MFGAYEFQTKDQSNLFRNSTKTKKKNKNIEKKKSKYKQRPDQTAIYRVHFVYTRIGNRNRKIIKMNKQIQCALVRYVYFVHSDTGSGYIYCLLCIAKQKKLYREHLLCLNVYTHYTHISYVLNKTELTVRKGNTQTKIHVVPLQ